MHLSWATGAGLCELIQAVVLRLQRELDPLADGVRHRERSGLSCCRFRLHTLRLQADGANSQRNFIGFPIPGMDGIPRNRFSNYGAALNLSWELDIWGRLRSA